MELQTHILSPAFEPILDVFEQNFTDFEELGAGFAVILDGEPVLHITGGWADKRKTIPYGKDTLVPVYSTTKGIAALALGGLVEAHTRQGYDTLVSEIWPEFGVNGKEATTIGHVVSHQAGLPGFTEEIDPALWLDPPACAAALATIAPMWAPGTAHGYHPLTWGYMVGELARRLDPNGRTLGQYIATTMTNTTGEMGHNDLIDFWIGLPESEHERCADIARPKALARLGEVTPPRRAAFMTKWAAPNRNAKTWREVEIPSANGHGTALSIAQMYEPYAANGAQGDNHITMTADMVRPFYPDTPDLVLDMNTSFAAGVMLNSHGHFGPNPDAVGHCGWGGSMAIADADRRLTCAYVMNKQSNILVGDPRATALVSAVYGCL